MPITLIARSRLCPLPLRAQRTSACRLARSCAGPTADFTGDEKAFVEDIRQALLRIKIVSYAQGYMLMREAAKEYKLEPELRRDCPDVARRLHHPRAFLGKIKEAFDKNPKLANLLLDDSSRTSSNAARMRGAGSSRPRSNWGFRCRRISTALAFFDGYRSERLPANLLQAQRDYFGAHTYERVDKPRGQFFHTNWTGRGGDVSSSTYNA